MSDETITNAIKGDKAAQEALMDQAEKLFSEGKFQDSAKTFKDAAVAYRWNLSKCISKFAEAEPENAFSEGVILLHKRYINRRLNEDPKKENSTKTKYSERAFFDKYMSLRIWEKYPVNCEYFYRLLRGSVYFGSPGASVQRRIYSWLTWMNHGFDEDSPPPGYVDPDHALEVSVAIDEIYDDLIKNMNI